MNAAETPWSVKVGLEDVPEGGRHVVLTADAGTRAAIAAAIGLVELPRLEARFEVRRHGRAGLKVQGTITASVVQICVVTLEPVAGAVAEEVEVVFAPESPDLHKDNAVADLDATAADPPEPLVGGKVDVGAVAVEFLVLGLDPYPRRPDAAFEPPAADDTSDGPFAALARLRPSREGT